MSRRLLVIFVTYMLALASMMVDARDFVVVIDAGHGGKDAGTCGRRLKEKDVTLDIAKRLGRMVAKLSDVKVVYTRQQDKFVSLQGRADIANNAQGDLFISIHVNSVKETSPGREKVKGVAVYTMGPDKSRQALEVAMRENSVMELEPDYTTRYRGFDPNSAESYISMEMSSNVNMKQSIDLARIIQSNLKEYTGRYDKGCHQAGFWVLWSPNMPSVLVEIEFMCNPDSEKWLSTDEAREKSAMALFASIKQYLATHHGAKTSVTVSSDKVASSYKATTKNKGRARRSDRKAKR